VNYLAHAYLSFGVPEILVGNLISDFIKGKKKLDYADGIQKGISLHRAIDHFTDTHESTRQAKSFFASAYRLYSGALTDIVYDHFLANDPKEFPADEPVDPAFPAPAGDPLVVFCQATYRQMATWQPVFPERFAHIFPYMRSQDWLYHYRFRQGIFNSFAGLARRAAYMPPPEEACRLFELHYEGLKACYTVFFPALKHFAFSTLQELASAGL
jgi:acyl carrier protein phosphodiesterase